MPLTYTAAPTSRISRSYRSSKSSSLPKSLRPGASKSRKPIPHKKPPIEEIEDTGEIIPASDLLLSTEESTQLSDTLQATVYILSHRFTPLPLRGGGFGREQIADIHNTRSRLPPFVTLAQIHALLNTPTSTDREIAALVEKGALRRITLGRYEGVVAAEDYYKLIEESTLDTETKSKYLEILRTNPTVTRLPGYFLTATERMSLLSVGFLTLASIPTTATPLSMGVSSSTLTSISSLLPWSSNPRAAVSIYGRGEPQHSPSSLKLPSSGGDPDITISLPNMGAFTKALTGARAHLLDALRKANKGMITEKGLREKWDGNGLCSGGNGGTRVNAQNGSKGTMAKMRKWKEFNGVSFEWVMGDLLGSGDIELFGTGVRGLRGVRLVDPK